MARLRHPPSSHCEPMPGSGIRRSRAYAEQGTAADLEDAYLNKVQNYSGQEIQIIKAYMTDKDYAQVSGGIVQQGSEPIVAELLTQAFALELPGCAAQLGQLGSHRTPRPTRRGPATMPGMRRPSGVVKAPHL
jgi:hypothetical protein